MSRYCGKFDFCDEVELAGIDRILQSDVYCGEKKLDLRSLEDCIPYYPHIIVFSCWDNISRKSVIKLSERSWVDIEEEWHGHMPIHDYYRQELQKELEVNSRADINQSP